MRSGSMPHDAVSTSLGVQSSMRRRQLLGGKAAEHHGMHRAQPRAGQHRHHRFGDHRHVDDDAVALADALRRDRAGELRHVIAQLAIGEALLRAGDRRIVDQRRLLGAAALDVAVERVVAGIELAAGEPAIERRLGASSTLSQRLRPVDRLGLLGPESLGVAERTRMQRAVFVADGHDGISSLSDRLSVAHGPPRSGCVTITSAYGLDVMLAYARDQHRSFTKAF